jgi:hypothetical protein
MVDGDDGVPAWVRRRAVELFDERRADIAVAELRYDSLLDETSSPSAPREVLFGLREHEVRLTFLGPPTDAVHILITPPARYHLVAHVLDDDERTVTTAEDGTANLVGIAHRPASLIVAPSQDEQPTWRTAWTRW